MQNLYQEIICNFENLQEGYRLAHRSKSECQEVVEFDKDVLGNLLRLRRQLINKEWDKIFEYYRFEITIPKKRIVDALTFKGRIVQHVLCDNILKPWFEKRLIKENCACREGKGTQYAANLVKQGMSKFLKNHDDGYCLKMDVKSYFPSIDRETLKNLLQDFPYEDIKEFLFWIIDHCPESNGLPIGNQTSQWMALYYLNKIDRIIKEKYRIKYYARYMDDLIIIHEDKKYLEDLLNELIVFANNRLKLTFNDKTQIFPLHKGISFLSWKFYFKKGSKKIITRLDSKKKKFRNMKIKEIKKNYRNGIFTKSEYYDRVRSIRAYLDYGDTWSYLKSMGL